MPSWEGARGIAQPAAAPPWGAVSTTLLQRETPQWVEGKRTIDDRGERSLVDGRFRLDGLPIGEVSVVVCSRESSPALASRITVVESSITEHVFGAGKGGALHATVTDEKGNPAPGAHFTMYYPSGEWLCLAQKGYLGSLDMNHDGDADTDGIIRIDRLPPGTMKLKVAQRGFQAAWTDILIEEGKVTQHHIQLTPANKEAPSGR